MSPSDEMKLFMKTFIKKQFLLPVLISGLDLILGARVTAQNFTTLHNFNGGNGAQPYAGLILSGNTLYGTTAGGGISNNGTVFSVNTNGTGFTNLHTLNGNDGFLPKADLILSGNTLYGTTQVGGSYGDGTVFALNTNGTGFTTLYSFSATSGHLKFRPPLHSSVHFSLDGGMGWRGCSNRYLTRPPIPNPPSISGIII